MKSICAVEGVRAAGVKEGKFGLALIEAKGTAAAVFTRNQIIAEPVKLMKERIRAGSLDGIIVNSGNANVYTGDAGAAAARRMCDIAAAAFGTTPERVGVASTGVIGRFPDVEIIERQCTAIAPLIRSDASAEDDAAAAIMTTDLYPKHALARGEGFTVAGITKGSGMIAPNMGTMLAFLYTDAAVPADELQAALIVAVDRSFNRVVVDGDTSTNDCVFLTATARKGRPDAGAFQAALEEVCVSLARQIAADGEGATKLLEVRVCGARTEDEAAAIARTVVGSPLVKTAVYGRDPNWGRIVAAAGRAGVPLDPGTLTVSLISGGEEVVFADRGAILADRAALARAKELMAGDTVTFALDLGEGGAAATAWGCDLTEKYVEINGKYTT
jgi:glutamate N-acetyltransferase/amino-acid N-acetyltransferase